jgi:hypothetical protein
MLYPHPPSGSVLPPQQFLAKMKSINDFLNDQVSEGQGAATLTNRFGMFEQPLFSYDNLPCSLHFEHSSWRDVPTDQAKEAMTLLHVNLLGMTFGAKEGFYGAGGGGVHILYLGVTFDLLDATCDSFPGIDTLLKMLHLSDMYKPEAMQWMTTSDPIHSGAICQVSSGSTHIRERP